MQNAPVETEKTRIEKAIEKTDWLDQIQKMIWLKQPPLPETNLEVLAKLSDSARICLQAFEHDQVVQAQSTLEDILVQVFIAMRVLQLKPSMALERALTRLDNQKNEIRIFHVYADRVEIRVNHEVRGQWPLYTLNDYQSTLRLAKELNCDLIHEDTCQLTLFQSHEPVVNQTE